MRKFLLFTIIAAVVTLTATTVYAAPPDKPPGLGKAIAAQEAHTDALLAIPGVVGTAVGLGADGQPVVKIYTKSAKITGLPKELDGVPVFAQATGEIIALDKPQNPGGGRNIKLVAYEQNAITTEDTAVEIILTGFNKNGCGASFTFSATPPANGSLDFYDGSMNCSNGYLTASVQYTPNQEFYNDFDSFTFTISDGQMTSNVANVSIFIVGNHQTRYLRPADIGTSSGSERLIKVQGLWYCTVGTLGVRLTDGTNVYALSNNHVYALEGKGKIGDRILQPGRVDMTGEACGSTAEIDDAVIGYLAAYVPIKFRSRTSNRVDAAVAMTTTEMVGLGTSSYGSPSSTPVEAALGMAVQKHGLTTGNTEGTIIGINATILVRYDSGLARFDGQIEVGGADFSDSGDSGSLIVTNYSPYGPVALLFAGGDTSTFGNPINDVLTELSAELGVILSIDNSQ